MVYKRLEGEKLKNGINYYPKSDPYNGGVIFRLGRLSLWFRYSKKLKKFFFRYFFSKSYST